MKLAILDDYQGVALEAADWSSIAPAVAISVFDAHLGDSDAVVRALGEFDIIVAMRERTPFPQYVLERLPKLRLLVTTGMRNLAIDLAAARKQGIDVCGTPMLGYPAAEHTWALILSLVKQVPAETCRCIVAVGRSVCPRDCRTTHLVFWVWASWASK